MSSAALCAMMLTVAIDFGYEPMENDGIRYVVQLSPHMIELLAAGQPIESTFEPAVRGRVHAFRFQVGEELLSRELPPLTATPTPPPEVGPFPAQADILPDIPPRTINDTNVMPAAVPLLPDQPEQTPESSPGDEPPSSEPDDLSEAEEPADDLWFPLILATLVAAGSSSGMVWFGWLALDYRSRYLGLLREAMQSDGSKFDEQSAEPAPRDERVTDEAFFERLGAEQAVSEDSGSEETGWSRAESDDGTVRDWLDGDSEGDRSSRRGRKKSR